MDGVIAFIDAFPEWHRVAIISQDEEMFRKARQMAIENVNQSLSSSHQRAR